MASKRFPGNLTRSYRSRYPLLVVDDVRDWKAHAPDVLRAMLDNTARLRAQGWT